MIGYYYGVLKENGPNRFIHAWFPVGGSIWEGLGGVSLVEEVYHWGKAQRFQKILLTECDFSAFCLQIKMQTYNCTNYHICALPSWILTL